MTATETADTEAIDRAPLLHVLVESPVISSTSALPANRCASQSKSEAKWAAEVHDLMCKVTDKSQGYTILQSCNML